MSASLELPNLDFEENAAGMLPGHSALALARAVELSPGMRILDLGTGQGVIALMLAARERVGVIGVDRESDVIAAAHRNARKNAPVLKGAVHWVIADMRALPWDCPGFDLAVMNPPYHRAGEGRLPPDPLRAAARHELHGALEDWVHAAAASLCPGGQVACVHLPRRSDEIVKILQDSGFEDIRVHPAQIPDGSSPAWCIIQARLASGTPTLL